MVESAKVLIVDDDVEFAYSLKDVLETEGYELESVNSGEEAISEIEKNPFDVILMDVKMPILNGVETFKKIKNISPKTPVIMITAFSFEDLIGEAMREGAFGILYKPLDFKRLIEIIDLAKAWRS